jgi:hypothetical protein
MLIPYYFTLLFKSKILTEFMVLILWSDWDNLTAVVFFYQKKSTLKWPNYWPKHVGEYIMTKIT